MKFKNVRLWIAGKVLGDIPYMKNITFYQTVCLDLDSDFAAEKCTVNLNHSIRINNIDGFNFDFYEKNLIK